MTKPSGSVLYRLRFIDRPDLNSDDFEAAIVYRAGDILGLRDGLEDPTLAWAITAVVPGREELPDTLVCDLVPRRTLTLSDRAAAFSKKRGGRIYVWAELLGSGAAWLQASIATDVTPYEITVRLSLSHGALVAEWPAGSVP